MRKTLLLCMMSLAVVGTTLADDFKVKLKIALVNHESPKGVSVVVLEKGVEVKSETIDSDGETKFELWKREDSLKSGLRKLVI